MAETIAVKTRVAVPPKPPQCQIDGGSRPISPEPFLSESECPHWFLAAEMNSLRACYVAATDGFLGRESPNWLFSDALEEIYRHGLVEVLSVVMINDQPYSRVFTCTKLGKSIVELYDDQARNQQPVAEFA
jgi:hypothetical protein